MANIARILLLEDDAAVRESLTSVLHDARYAVDCFDGGGRALEYLDAGHVPDLILTDLMLRNDMNGWQFVELIRQRPALKDVPVVALTGASLDRAAVKQLKAQTVLQKPFEIEDLLSVVRQFLPSVE